MDTVTQPKPEKKVIKENQENKSSKAPLIALLLTTLLFLGASGYLYYTNTEIQKKNDEQASTIASLEELKKKAEKEADAFEAKVAEEKGKSQELENLLATANDDIAEKAKRIKELTRYKASVKTVQKEYNEMKAKVEGYLARIAELEAQIAALQQENEGLKTRTVELDKQIATLQERNALLEKKVQMASALKTANVIVIGEKKGKKGYLPTSLKKAERLMITFDVLENKVAEPGEKSVYITVTGPNNKTIETSESGTFTNAENNVSTPYTLIHKFSYTNSDQKEAAHVELKKEERKPGNYTIEFYSDGVLCGIKQITLK